MTPAQELGYKVGDKFVVINAPYFDKGTVVYLENDDGTGCPLFTDIKYNYKSYYVSLDSVEPIIQDGSKGVKDMSTLEEKIKSVLSLDKVIKDAQKERDSIIKAINEDMPEGTTITFSETNGADDINDPKNWKAGDRVICVNDDNKFISKGCSYLLFTNGIDEDGHVGVYDNDGDRTVYGAENFQIDK